MNMLASLKSLLFTSTAAGANVSAPTPATGAADFAALLNGTIAEAAPGVDPLALPKVDGAAAADASMVAAPAEEIAVDGPPVEKPVEQGPDAPVPHGLAIAVAAGKAQGVPLSLPPGLALGLVKRADAPAPAEPAPPEPAASAPAEVAQTEESVASPAEDMPQEAPEAAPEPQLAQPVKAPKAPRPARQAQVAVAVPVPSGTQDIAPVEAVSDEREEPKSEQAEQQASLAAAPAVSPPPIMAPPPIIVAAPVPQGRAPVEAPPPVRVQKEAMPAPAEGQDQLAAVPGPEARPAQPAVADRAQAAPPVQAASAPARASQAKPSDGKAGPMAKALDGPAPSPRQLSEAIAAGDEAPAAPVLNGKPLKSEALALLQLVREQVGARPSGLPARVGEQVSALASKRAQSGSVAAEAVVAASPVAAPDLPQVATAPSAPAPASTPSIAAPAQPAVDLSASLNSQMVDMGVSGQWIDGLARDIAGLSAHGAQGRFQINADQLGPVQVDIRQGSEGAAVHLTVASEAAEMALRQDSDRLKLDAGLAAVRIAEVKIDRAPHVSELSRADTAGQQSSQQQSQQSAGQGGAWANNGQNMGQPQGQQGQQGRWRPGENNGFTPKSSGDPAVLNHAQERQDASDSRRARYA